MKRLIICILAMLSIILTAQPTLAASTKVTGTLSGCSGCSMLLLRNNSVVARTTGKNLNKKLSSTSNVTIAIRKQDGTYGGTVTVNRVGNKVYQYLSKKTGTIALGKITYSASKGCAWLKNFLPKSQHSTTYATRGSGNCPTGAGRLGAKSPSTSALKKIKISAASTTQAGDSDKDGIPNAFDVDDDNDGILDGQDSSPNGVSSSAISVKDSSASNNPFTTLYLGLNETLNSQIAAVSDSDLDAIVGGSNVFSLIIYTNPQGISASSANVVCAPSNPWCGSSGTAVYSGISESDQSLISSISGGLWRNFTSNGQQNNLESFNSSSTFAGGMQPRSAASDFQIGDTLLVEYRSSGGSVQSTLPLTISPYFVTVPALYSYDAGFGTTVVDYGSGTAPGSSQGNPIVLSSSGTLTMNFYPPQRKAIPGAETSGTLFDMGRLHYGVIFGGSGINSEFTCGGLYSGFSSSLSAPTDGLGTGSSISPQDGANLWPVDDSADDAATDPSSLKTVTIDLKTCLTRASVSFGTYQLSLTAAGENLTGGANRAAQTIWVSVN
ncbi:MAG: thrombospondin type 3 repeat-containing protein [Oligoflexia bacterium]|nr:thrombospondin type 3 repeat-containing protein [Oligoflexia bacterium]